MDGTIRLNAVGDVMLGDFPLTLGFGVQSSIRNGTVKNPLNKIKHVLKDCDICLGNLETVLSDYGYKDKDIRSAQMRGDSCFVDLLKDAGFNVMSVANNHAMQHGPEAFMETVTGLNRNGIVPIGIADKNKKCVPCFLERNGIRVCFLGYSLRPEKYCSQVLYAQSTASEIVEDIKSNKTLCDVVVVSLHWGDEFVQVPSPEQICNAHSFIDAGAALIIGHHPHIIQGIERYQNGVIAYSLGNFVFDFWQKMLRKTMILHCELSKKGVESFNITPVEIEDSFHPVILTGYGAENLVQMVNVLSEKIKTINTECNKDREKYNSSVKNSLMINKIENRLFFIRKIFKYKCWVVIQSLNNFVSPKV